MRVFRESGFFDQQPLELGGARVLPRELTSHLLFAQWRLAEGEADLTVMRVEIGGLRGGAVRSYRFDLLDRYDAATKTTSMARTTGYTCTMAARQLLAGRFARKGVCPPEFMGRDQACFDAILAGLEARGVHLETTVSEG